MDMNQLMAMLMDLLQTPPNQPAGNSPTSLPAGTVPPQIAQGDPLEQLLPLLMERLAGMGMMQGGQQMQNGAMGGQGAMFGGTGGRPPAGSVPPSAIQ
jgi:hypothetical protein